MEEENYNDEEPKSFFFDNVKKFDDFLTEKNINQVKLFLPYLVILYFYIVYYGKKIYQKKYWWGC